MVNVDLLQHLFVDDITTPDHFLYDELERKKIVTTLFLGKSRQITQQIYVSREREIIPQQGVSMPACMVFAILTHT